MLVFEGVPLLYIELTVGQMLRKGSMGSWIKISPYMQGNFCSLNANQIFYMVKDIYIKFSLKDICLVYRFFIFFCF